MDIHEIRRQYLQRLIDERFDGVKKRCADALDMKPPQIHRWLSLTTKDRRRIEYESARSIERKLNLPHLSMDGVTESTSKDESRPREPLEAKDGTLKYAVGVAQKADGILTPDLDRDYSELTDEGQALVRTQISIAIETARKLHGTRPSKTAA